LLDVWAKKNTPGSVYYDVPGRVSGREGTGGIRESLFGVVREARDNGDRTDSLGDRQGQPLQGWQVDNAARTVIDDAGYGKYFFHRTGHSIGESVHGNGVNMDGLETKDTRRLIPRTCTSIERGFICANLVFAVK